MKKISKWIFPVIFCCFLFFLLVFSNSNISAVKKGLNLWANSVVPSLFPFFIASELLGYTQVVYYLGKILTRFMLPIFNVPGEGAFPFIMGIISGYPVGAKIVTNLRENNILTVEEAERLLAFTNNSGPLFIIGTVGICFFNNSLIGTLLLITHLLACISVGFIFRFWKCNKQNTTISKTTHFESNKSYCTFSNLGEILSKSILTSINTILLIGGFIILFCVIISILERSKFLLYMSHIIRPILRFFKIDVAFAKPILTGLIELTSGCSMISLIKIKTLSTNIIVSSFLLGFGGFSVLLQVLGIISKSDISIKPYIYGKLLQAILAAFYTYIAISYFPIFNFNL